MSLDVINMGVVDVSDLLAATSAKPLRHQTFYKAVFRPAVARANGVKGQESVLPPSLKFHALRHTYAILCVAAGIPPLHLSRFMGHARVTTTLSVYTHLFDDDHTDAMVSLEAINTPAGGKNVIALYRRHSR